MRAEQDVIRIWEANEVLLRDRIFPLVIRPLSKPPGLPGESDWDYMEHLLVAASTPLELYKPFVTRTLPRVIFGSMGMF
jgi:hypothetical protein